MLDFELNECERILDEMDEEVEGVMYDLDICLDDAKKMLRVKEILAQANEQKTKNKEMRLCV